MGIKGTGRDEDPVLTLSIPDVRTTAVVRRDPMATTLNVVLLAVRI